MANEVIQFAFDYSVLSPEQAQRTQEAEYRIIGRTQKTIVENGRDLLAVKKDIGHGHFLGWIRSLGISEDAAERSINVAKNFGQIPHGAEFSDRVLYLLSTSKVPESARKEAKERAKEGEEITEEVARQIRDAHKAKEQSEERERQLRNQLFHMQEEIDSREPQTVEKEVVPPDYEELKTQVKQLTEERDNEAARAETFAKRYQEDLSKQREEEYAVRIRQHWRSISSDFHAVLNRWYEQSLSTMTLQCFEVEDWIRLENMERRARKFIEDCHALHQRNVEVIDAS